MYNINLKMLFAGTVGTFLEWLDYSLYGYMATKIATLFFPKEDLRIGLLATFSIFAVGFIARPLGAILFGHLGDKFGRRIALTSTILLMGFATLALGLIPTYNKIGIVAPILLIVCRLLQGLAVAGESNGASIFLIEHYPEDRPYLMGSCMNTAAMLGMLCGTATVTIVTLPHMPPWAWRLPFIVGFISCIIGVYLRRGFIETPDFLAISYKNKLAKIPFLESIRHHKANLLKTILLVSLIGIYIYTCNLYFTTYLTEHVHLSPRVAAIAVLSGLITSTIFIPIFAMIADAIDNGRIVAIIGIVGAIIVAPLLFRLSLTGSILLIILGQVVFGFTYAAICAPVAKILFDLFPTRIRYTAISFAWSTSVAIFGGTAPVVAQFLIGELNLFYGPAYYATGSAVIALIAVIMMKPKIMIAQSNKHLYNRA